MGKKIPANNAEKSRKLIIESLLIRKRFPFLNTRIIGDRLVCRGHMQPTDDSARYRLEFLYKPWFSPKVLILHPYIEPLKELHFYNDGSLCLYDWREQPWQKMWHLADTVIPWTAEWLLYYEIYKLTGTWCGLSAVHDKAKSREPADEVEAEQQAKAE